MKACKVITTLSLVLLSSFGYGASNKFTTEFLPPAGVWATNFNFNVGYLDSRYDKDGNKIPIGAETNGFQLDSIAPLLADPNLDAALASGLSLGATRLKLTYHTQFLETTFGYGLTDDLSIGGRFIVGESCSKAIISTENTTVPGFDLNSLLLGPFGYSDVDENCFSGLISPTLAMGWRVYDGDDDSLLLLPSLRFGRLANHLDADVLFEPLIDDGSNDIVLRADYFRDLRPRLDLHTQIEYGIQLSDKQEKRVPLLPVPIADASAKEKLDRDLGDYLLLDVELGYRFMDDQLRTHVAWYQKSKKRDKYVSDVSGRIEALESNSNYTDREIRIGLSYDGIPAWKAGKLPLPLQLQLTYWQSIGGENNLEYHFGEFHITLAF